MRQGWMLVLAGVVACSGGTEPPPGDGGNDDQPGAAAQLQVVAGADQVGTVGAELSEPVVVKVADAQGLAVGGQIINFVVVEGGGSVFAGTAQANSSGEVRERWTLGPTAGEQILEARAVDQTTGEPIVFQRITATALPGPPASITLRRADTTATVGEPLDLAGLVTGVADRFGNPVDGATLTAVAGGDLFTTNGSTVTASREGEGQVTIAAGGAAMPIDVTALVSLESLVGLRGTNRCRGTGQPVVLPDGSRRATMMTDAIVVDSAVGGVLWFTRDRTTTYDDGFVQHTVTPEALGVLTQKPGELWFNYGSASPGGWLATGNGIYQSTDLGLNNGTNWCRWQAFWDVLAERSGYTLAR